MKATTQKRLMLAALLALAPAGAALAADNCATDPSGAYHRGLGADDAGYQCVQNTQWQAGAAGPAGPVIASADKPCGIDPFDGTRRAFNTGGPAQLCGLMVSDSAGAKGPAGPTMGEQQRDPFLGYSHTFPDAD